MAQERLSQFLVKLFACKKVVLNSRPHAHHNFSLVKLSFPKKGYIRRALQPD